MASGFPPPAPEVPTYGASSVIRLFQPANMVYHLSQPHELAYRVAHYDRIHAHLNEAFLTWKMVDSYTLDPPPLAGRITITMKSGFALDWAWLRYFVLFARYVTWRTPEVMILADEQVVTNYAALIGEEEVVV